ncbi:MAG: AMP-binding protein, partial [Acidimicrobiia bacterium]
MSKGALGLLSAYWPERTARHAHIPLERISQFSVHRPSAADPNRPALITPGRTVTFAELAAMVGAVAGHLGGRVGEGGRVAVVAEDPVELAAVALGCLEADRLAFLSSVPVEARILEAFSPDLVVGAGGVDAAGLLSGRAATPGKPNLRLPVLALPRPWPGEVLHNHKTLVATAVSFGSFFMLEPGAEVVSFEPPTSWLGLATLLGTWHKGATLRAAWGPGWTGYPHRVDYFVSSWEAAEARYLGSAPTLRDVHAGVGAILGISRPFSAGRRRRLTRRLRTPVFTLFGRNDLGPTIGSHPTWYL